MEGTGDTVQDTVELMVWEAEEKGLPADTLSQEWASAFPAYRQKVWIWFTRVLVRDQPLPLRLALQREKRCVPFLWPCSGSCHSPNLPLLLPRVEIAAAAYLPPAELMGSTCLDQLAQCWTSICQGMSQLPCGQGGRIQWRAECLHLYLVAPWEATETEEPW